MSKTTSRGGRGTDGGVERAAGSEADEGDGASLLEGVLPAGVQSLIELFSRQLGAVAFPDVSAATLEQAVKDLGDRAQALETARAKVAAATAKLEASRTALLRQAARALAYARVFAAEDADLSEALNGIRLESDRPQAARGRPRKEKPAPAEAAPADVAPEASA